MKVALIQQKAYNTKEKTIAKTVSYIKKASKNGAELVVLQELHQSYYFCQNENSDNFDLASSWEEDKIFWSNIAKKYKVVLVTSLFEKRAAGLYHNTAVVFEKDGTIAGQYRKMHIPDDPGFYEKFYFTQGDMGFEPIDTSVGRLGVLICWDQWYPEAARIMTLKGADMLIYPTAIGWFDEDSKKEKQRQKEAWFRIQQSHTIANNIPVISVNRVGFEKDDSKVLKGIRFWGGSFVVDAGGETLVVGSEDEEEILYAMLDKTKTENLRRWWPFLRDRRVEYYQDINKLYID